VSDFGVKGSRSRCEYVYALFELVVVTCWIVGGSIMVDGVVTTILRLVEISFLKERISHCNF